MCRILIRQRFESASLGGTARSILSLLMIFSLIAGFSQASEIIKETNTRVIIREHPKTGKPYVSIISSETAEPPDPFTGQRGRIIRPDYRMLDPKVKSGEIPYEGPVSDRKKVYIFAASMATLGVAGAASLPIAASTGAASGGAGAYVAAGTAVAAGSAGAYSLAARPDPQKEDYSHTSEYQLAQSLRGSEPNDAEAISNTRLLRHPPKEADSSQ